MNGVVYIIMLFMFVVVTTASYMITKILLTKIIKWVSGRRTNKRLEAVYRETMKY